MKEIEQALEKEITRGNCDTCPKRAGDFCDVTEEKIGSGDEYCELKPIAPQDNWENFASELRGLYFVGKDELWTETFFAHLGSSVKKLLASQKEENDREWRRRADTLIADQMKEFANTELSKRKNAFDELYEVRKKINLLK